MKELSEYLEPKTMQSVMRSVRDNGEVITLFIAVLAVTALIVFWALYIRKPNYSAVYSRIDGSPKISFKKRRRKRKHHHSHRNPTLAETGGLRKTLDPGPPPGDPAR